MLGDLARKNVSLLDDVLSLLPMQGRIVEMLRFSVPALMKTASAERAWGIIQRLPVPNRHAHELDYFHCLAEDDIDKCDIDRMCALLEVIVPRFPWCTIIELVEKFERRFPRSLVVFLRRLLEKREESEKVVLRGVFSVRSVPQILTALSGEISLLKSLYLAAIQDDPDQDSQQEVLNHILNEDPGFVEELAGFDWENAGGGRRGGVPEDLFFTLWMRADSAALADRVIDFVIRQDRSCPWSSVAVLDRLFLVDRSRNGGGSRGSRVLSSRDAYLVGLISRRSSDSEIMEVTFRAIADLGEIIRRKCLAAFLQNNQSFADFANLDLVPSLTSGSGEHGLVFAHLAKATYLESLLPMVRGVAYLQHKAHIEELMRNERDSAENERRRAFQRAY